MLFGFLQVLSDTLNWVGLPARTQHTAVLTHIDLCIHVLTTSTHLEQDVMVDIHAVSHTIIETHVVYQCPTGSFCRITLFPVRWPINHR